MDDSEVRRHLDLFKRMGPKMSRAVVRGTVNGMAFATKEVANTKTLARLHYKNQPARAFTMKGVYVEKAKQSGDIQAEVGAIGKGGSTNRKEQRTSYLRRQELGGRVQQLKSPGGAFRSTLVAPDPAHNRGGQTPRLKGKAAGPDSALVKKFANRTSRFVRRLKFRTRDRILYASALAAARQQGLRYAITPFGVYRVGKKKATRIQSFRRGITTPARPWLMPAATEAMRTGPTHFVNAMNRELKKAGFAA